MCSLTFVFNEGFAYVSFVFRLALVHRWAGGTIIGYIYVISLLRIALLQCIMCALTFLF